MSKIESVSVCVARVPLDRSHVFRDPYGQRARLLPGQGPIDRGFAGYRILLRRQRRRTHRADRRRGNPRAEADRTRLPSRGRTVAGNAYGIAAAGPRGQRHARAQHPRYGALGPQCAQRKAPLYRYLGSVTDDKVPAYASGGYYLDGKTPEKLGEEMASYVAAGFQAVKMKVGRLSPAQEEARINAVRRLSGPMSS